MKGDNEVMGAVTIQNGFASQGKLVVNGPLHAAALDFEGRLVAKEWVADRIEGRLKGESSRATSIRAAVIRIVRGSWTGSRVILEADRIEGREIELENVVCEVRSRG